MKHTWFLITVVLLIGLMGTVGSAVKTEIDTQKMTAAYLSDMSSIQVPEKALATSTLYVNSKTGNDSTGTGASKKPFKTITHAMDIARDGTTVIVEGANTYDTANGEVFPIRMKSGVTLTGKKVDSTGVYVPVTKRPVIKGGARYDIPDSPNGRYVAILGADRATISGLTFQGINTPGTTSDDGSPILCDSTSPTIRDNTFSGKAHAGISTLGDAHPAITGNTFTGELSWGITTYAESYPSINSNSFSCTNGIDCSADSYPTVDANKFSCTSTGISAKSASHPVFTNNEVKGNGEYGIMIRMDCTPVFEKNKILQNPIGIYTAPSGTAQPDIGGGGRSTGGNEFDNYEWNIYHRGPVDISAKKNSWGSPCCEGIHEKIYDKEDDSLSGTVDVGTCMICTASLSVRPVVNTS